MEVEQKSKDTLGDLADEPLPLKLGDTEYKLTKLKISDLGAVQQWLRGKAVDFAFEKTRMVELGEESRAIACHLNVTKAYTTLELMNDQESRFYLLYLSVRRGGYKETFEKFTDEVEIGIVERLISILFWITGISKAPKEESSDPTTTTPEPSPSTPGEKT